MATSRLRSILDELEQGDASYRSPTAPTTEPADDVPKRRGLRSAPPDTRQRTYRSLDQGQAMIRHVIAEYLADPMPSQMLLVAAPAGIGKTTIGVQTAEAWAAEGRKVMYVGPRKEFFTDLMALARRPAWWYAWQSRHGGDADGLGQTCRWPHQIQAWQERGYDARAFCSNPRICGWHYIHTNCRYYAQEGHAKDIIFAQYEHVAMGHLLLSKMSLIIGDELPIRAFLHPWSIPTHKIVPDGMDDGPVAQLVRRLETLTLIPRGLPRRRAARGAGRR